MKACSKCAQAKPHEEFYADKRYADGLYPQCKECKRAVGRERAKAWYAKNSERHIGNVIARRKSK